MINMNTHENDLVTLRCTMLALKIMLAPVKDGFHYTTSISTLRGDKYMRDAVTCQSSLVHKILTKGTS